MRFYHHYKHIVLGLLFVAGGLTANAQQLSTPKVLSFSTTLNHTSRLQELMLKNTGDKTLVINRLVLKGDNATSFMLQTQVVFPFEIGANQARKLSFTFSPKTNRAPEMLEAELVIESNMPPQRVSFKGVVAKGLEGNLEPPLQMIVETLGYAIDVGGDQLHLGMEAPRLGAEVKATHFTTAIPSKPVILMPVARYSPAAEVPIGYYFRNKNDELRYVKTATLSASETQHQTVFPILSSGEITFKPADIPFGVFVSTKEGALYSEDKLNDKDHTLRVYPLIDSQNKVIPGSYLLCFEEASNGDYQDYVFVLKNVAIATP